MFILFTRCRHWINEIYSLSLPQRVHVCRLYCAPPPDTALLSSRPSESASCSPPSGYRKWSRRANRYPSFWRISEGRNKLSVIALTMSLGVTYCAYDPIHFTYLCQIKQMICNGHYIIMAMKIDPRNAGFLLRNYVALQCNKE